VETREEARALVLRYEVIDGSGHTGMECAECHTAYGGFPHVEEAETVTCGSADCHGEPHGDWEGSVHAAIQDTSGVEGATCVQCHGIHDIPSVEAMEVEGGPAMLQMNAACAECHTESALPAWAPHADTVLCASCHAPHDTRRAGATGSWMAPAGQMETCGECHVEPAEDLLPDAHGQALLDAALDSLPPMPPPGDSIPPACTSCHGAHPMPDTASAGFQSAMVANCAACHVDLAERYYDSYHGKAVRLGSEAAASCSACHGAHGIYAEDHPRSMVAEANLVETCGDCHEHARPAFVEYDSHPDFNDRDRNPILFYSFWFMTTLVVGTLTVFGLHTLLWWIRIAIDERRAGGHHA
jgi:hypothetical protein